jgi:hypothetical protein
VSSVDDKDLPTSCFKKKENHDVKSALSSRIELGTTPIGKRPRQRSSNIYIRELVTGEGRGRAANPPHARLFSELVDGKA